MAETVESKHGICLCACCSFENHDAHGPCGHPCTEPEDKPLGAEASVRVLNAELNAVGIGKRPQYADLCRAIHGILAAYAAAQRVIAELRTLLSAQSNGAAGDRNALAAAEARCAELTKERESFKLACFEASEESRQAWLASEIRCAEQAERIETLTEALGDLVSDAERQMANPSHHMPFSLPKARAALAGLPGKKDG